MRCYARCSTTADNNSAPIWNAKYGGMDVSNAKRSRLPEDENRELKKLLAESMFDQADKKCWAAGGI
jgi:hypothetical protein